jgi:ADP-L-glycero-D-manno-heptose 6-epimerase
VINSVHGTGFSPQELAARGLIDYIPFPPGLKDKYQSFTEADLSRLRGAGYQAEFKTVEQGVAAYVGELQRQ